jgi:hypothetical protein
MIFFLSNSFNFKSVIDRKEPEPLLVMSAPAPGAEEAI